MPGGKSSDGRHIGSEDGDGSDIYTAPGAEWVAVYNFDAAGGVYKVLLRAQEFGSDSVRTSRQRPIHNRLIVIVTVNLVPGPSVRGRQHLDNRVSAKPLLKE